MQCPRTVNHEQVLENLGGELGYFPSTHVPGDLHGGIDPTSAEHLDKDAWLSASVIPLVQSYLNLYSLRQLTGIVEHAVDLYLKT
jgi:hypothetical protein